MPNKREPEPREISKIESVPQSELQSATQIFRQLLVETKAIIVDQTYSEGRQNYVRFHEEASRIINDFGGQPIGFSSVLYGCGGPDIAGVIDTVADNGHLIAAGDENIMDFSQIALLKRDGIPQQLVRPLIASRLRTGMYADPSDVSPKERGLVAYLVSLALADVDPNTITISEKKVLKDAAGVEIASMTTLQMHARHHKSVKHTIFSGIHLDDSGPLKPTTSQAEFVLSELHSMIPKDGDSVLGISKASRMRGVLAFAEILPKQSTLAMDFPTEVNRIARDLSPLEQFLVNKNGTSLCWGYEDPLHPKPESSIYMAKITK